MIELKEKQKEKSKELEEYMLALEDPTLKQDIDFGNSLFPQSKKRELDTQRGVLLEKEKVMATISSLKSKYKYVFSQEEMKKECIEYHLEIIPAQQYSGNFDYEYIAKVRKFTEDNNLGVSRADLQYCFYILKSEFTNNNPLIFYKHKEGGNYYFIMIEGDKNYVNLTNLFLGYMYYNETTMGSVKWMASLSFFTTLVVISFFITGVPLGLFGSFILFIIATLLSIFAIGCGEFKEYQTNEYKFKSPGHLLNQ